MTSTQRDYESLLHTVPHQAGDPEVPFLFPIVSIFVLIATVLLFRLYTFPAGTNTRQAARITPSVQPRELPQLPVSDAFATASARFPEFEAMLGEGHLRQSVSVSGTKDVFLALALVPDASAAGKTQHLFIVTPAVWADSLHAVPTDCMIAGAESEPGMRTASGGTVDGRILALLKCAVGRRTYLFSDTTGAPVPISDPNGMLPRTAFSPVRPDGGIAGSPEGETTLQRVTVRLDPADKGTVKIDIRTGITTEWLPDISGHLQTP